MRDEAQPLRLVRLRRRTHFLLDSGGVGDRTAQLVHGALVTLVILSVAAVVLESDADIAARYGAIFAAIEYVAVAAFSVEYALRLWSAPEHRLYADLPPLKARAAFALSASALVDLAAILPALLSFFLTADLRILLILRLARFFKLARYSPGIRSIVAVLEAERKALAATGVVLFGVVLLMAAAMYVVERDAQPEHFRSIPASMWWAIQTVATVGYGDVTPTTAAGRIVAAVTMVMGFVMLGLPVGIVATAFAEEIHRRDFVVTWSMVARAPLFATLDASAIAEIMRYLRAQSLPPGALVVRRGEPAHSMYFIAAGEVEIELAEGPARLGEGQFFGEVALLRKTSRTANVRAITPIKLLVLDAFDLHVFLQRNPEVGRRIEEVAASRAEFRARSRDGDLIEAEIDERDIASRAGAP
ncbi:cyclic nucleotide-gated ion channel [Methylosinus trichosporium]|uniref:Cyclic nucleotide-binding protein n=1 Tax=Methylosinus trichosporium (strain ATCC 35070 / NCIMB 11131 / UNIQEM 75 / OB3b) TaxID=595536 RepID=A0A2D2D040_METT3|nr:cyclic nucleotide-gated ion channel [Methylosinus trichosporium]ATQ68367.1 cyclic nucleotide-binding protein [Methylosinus trichosporium OB3b]